MANTGFPGKSGEQHASALGAIELRRQESLPKTGALQNAIFNSANFSSIATDEKGVIQIFNVGAERMLGYAASEVVNAVTPADISDPRQLIARAQALSLELGTPITPGFEALVFKASRGIEDIYELTYIRKDGSRFPAIVSVTALRDDQDAIIGYLLIGTDNTARQQADDKLRTASQYARSLIEASLDPLVTISPEGKITDVNAGSVKVTGVPREKLIGTDFSNYFTEPEKAREGYQQVFAKGFVTDYPLTIRHEDGRLTDVLYNASVYKDAQGNVLGVFAAARDITARKQAEAALLKAGALQSAIFNSANFSSIATDAKGVIQIFNVGAERMLGYTAAEVMNKITPADISDPQEVIAHAKALSVELGTPITPGFEALVFKASRGIEDIYELTYFRKDGSRFPAVVSVTALRDAQENIIGYLLIGTDNTARKQAEEALLKAGALQSAIFNSANFSSIATDAKGVIQIFNVGAERMLGYTAAEVMNKITPADISDPQELIARAEALSLELDTTITPGFEALVFKASRGIEDIYELTYIRKDGSRFGAVVSVTALRDDQDAIIGYLLIGTDNTARKQAEEAQALLDQKLRDQQFYTRSFQEKNIELEHANRMKSEFLATMSHELRTPLNAIIGFSEALKDGLVGPMSDIQNEYIGDIFNSGHHLLSLINDILDLSKVEAGMMTLELEPVDLKLLLSNSLSIVREKAAVQGILLEFEPGKDLGLCQLDMRKTKQIIYNLLSNAVKFTNSGGKVTLRARRVLRSAVGTMQGDWPVHSFPLASSEYSEFIELWVCDNGIGISRENMVQLFQAFRQIDSGLARKFEGTGLGLAMVKQLVELHGGTVAVASAEGEGACFSAWLPLRAAIYDNASLTNTAGAPASVFADTHSRNDRVALVVDDDEKAAELVSLLLEAEGFNVLIADSAEAALLLALQHTLSLITLDIQLPGVDGWEFLLKIREIESLANVPVVIVSGFADRNMALKHGAAAVLQKPISRAQLHLALKNSDLYQVGTRTRTVLVVDDDPKAVEVIAAFLPTPDYVILRAYGGSEAIILAERLKPDLILLDLMMPDVSGFDVIEALQRTVQTSRIPILVVTAKEITALDRVALNTTSDKVIQIVEKSGFYRHQFIAEVRRALLPK